jgi:DNA-binding CsgD family transcriptional regulator
VRIEVRQVSRRLLERGDEIKQLVEALRCAASGTGQLVVVHGPAGVGKTELVGTALRHARSRGMHTLSGHGVELEREYAFGVARQIYAPLLRDRPEDEDDCFSGPARLVRPLLDGSLPDSGSDGEFPFLHGFFWLVGNVAESAPVLLALDDAHWSDTSSLRALLYLIQRLDELSVCLVVAVREGEPKTPTRLLTELEAHPGARVLRPEPLSRAAVGQAVRTRLGQAEQPFVDACFDVTDGNPFLLGELLATVEAEEIAPTSAGAIRVRELVPRAVLDAMLVRLARVGPEATALARALAVLGRSELRTAAALAGLAPEVAAIAADALTAASILRQNSVTSFVHPLLRSAIYAGIGRAERARMHRGAARFLFEEGMGPAVVAAQLLVADRRSDPWTVEVLRRAARAALVEGAPASAARYLERALEEPPRADLRGEVLAELASAEAVAGLPEAVPRLRAALDLIDEPSRRVRLRIELAEALNYLGQHLQASDALEAGRGELGDADRELALELEATWIGIARLDASLRARAMPRLAELARGLRGDTPVERLLLAHEANRKVFAGDPHTEVSELARRAWAGGALLEDGRRGGFASISALAALGWCDEFDAYEEGLRAMQADARRRGLVLDYAQATYGLHLAHHLRGRLADAVADGEGAVDARRYGWRGRHLASACSQLSWTLIELADLEGAARILQLPELEEARGSLVYAVVHDARGRLAAARGDPRQALAEFLAAGCLAETAPIVNPSYLPWRSSAAVVASRLGDRDRARELVREELRRAERFGLARPIGIAMRAAGLIERRDEGIELLRAAEARLSASPARLEYARTLTELGAALRRRGNRRDAREPLREGLALAIGFGATALERRARSELLAAGARPRRRQFSGVDALTPSERRVAEMAASGMSNREIAEALFVTVKAVHWHLGNTYRKLGVSSREQLGPEILGGGSSDSVTAAT